MKQSALSELGLSPVVAPRTGAWIETVQVEQVGRGQGVAPRTGAWIETESLLTARECRAESPPARGRGLKLFLASSISVEKGRPPHGGVD